MVASSIAEETLEDDLKHDPEGEKYHEEKIGTDPNFKRIIVWRNVIGFFFAHLGAVYGLSLILTFQIKLITLPYVYFLQMASGLGITMGAHRLFAHKSYKATTALKFILISLQTMAGQNCMFIWVRDHRLHHKYSDTDADPHNARRGFFFSHCGWLMSKKHPLVLEKGQTIDMTDLEADGLVMWQKRYFFQYYFLTGVLIPVIIPIFLWDETSWNAFFTCYIFRYIIVLHQTWCVNSAAHLFGTKPFDKYIFPSQNGFVSIVAAGEGWHNYHHVFPWDYRTSEEGSRFNVTKKYIDLAHKYGFAYDLKTAPYQMVQQRSKRTGNPILIEGAQKVKTYRWGDEKELEYSKEEIKSKMN